MEDADIKPDSKTFSYLIANCKCEEDIVKVSIYQIALYLLLSHCNGRCILFVSDSWILNPTVDCFSYFCISVI